MPVRPTQAEELLTPYTVEDRSRLPVIAGTGQVANKDDDRIVHPMVLVEEAARMALDAAGVHSKKVGGVFTTPLSALAESDPAGLLAERLGAGAGPRVVSNYSGAAPQKLLALACRAVAEGSTEVALVAGGIADASVRRARRNGEDPPALPTSVWSQGSKPPGGLPKRSWGGGFRPEIAAGAGLPSSYFALVQSALDRGRNGTDRGMRLGSLLAPFTEVAARRPPVAWFPTVRTAEEIARPSERNRMVAEPYTKLMCSFPTVDMAAALVVTASATGHGLTVRPVAIVSASDASPPSGWQAMDRPRALPAAVQEVFRLSATTPDKVARFDLYSCFPAAVLLAAAELGLDPGGPKPLTATGGLPYFGGPGASYSLHGLACLFEDLHAGGAPYGAALGVGGMVTDFSIGVYGLDDAPFRSAELVVPEPPPVPAARLAQGPAVVEAGTVLHDRDRGPVEAPVIARLPSGSRVGARCADPAMAENLSGRNLVGAEVELTTVDGKVYYRSPPDL
jgi:acetyl-CoA C-acetyltransferase